LLGLEAYIGFVLSKFQYLLSSFISLYCFKYLLLNVLVIAAIHSHGVEKVLVAQESVFQTFQTLYGVFKFLHNQVSANHTHIRNVGSILASIHSSTQADQFLKDQEA